MGTWQTRCHRTTSGPSRSWGKGAVSVPISSSVTFPRLGSKRGTSWCTPTAPSSPRWAVRVRYLSMDDYATLKAATFDSYRETFTPLTKDARDQRFGLLDNSRNPRWHMRPENQWEMEGLYEFLKSSNKWGKKLKVWHSRLAVIRSRRSPVGEPIAASSDESALFELIYSAGGRMPGEATQ